MMRNARRQTAACNSTGRQNGFTIVELLIATLIFSLVLILITVGVLTFTKVYYKGLNQSKTQNATRAVIETISQSIQFSRGVVTSPISDGPNQEKGFCVADKRFSYLPGLQLVDEAPDTGLGQTRHALVMDETGSCIGAQSLRDNPNPLGVELLTPGMRISKLSVQQIPNTQTYNVSLRIAYGDSDLLYSPSRPDDPNGASLPDAACRFNFTGSHFCATAELSTIVTKRIN